MTPRGAHTSPMFSGGRDYERKALALRFFFFEMGLEKKHLIGCWGNTSFWLVNRNVQLHTQTLDSLSKREVFIVIPWKNAITIFVLLLTVYLIPIKGPWYTNLYLAPYTNDNENFDRQSCGWGKGIKFKSDTFFQKFCLIYDQVNTIWSFCLCFKMAKTTARVSGG